jgi:hypothetical protein
MEIRPWKITSKQPLGIIFLILIGRQQPAVMQSFA